MWFLLIPAAFLSYVAFPRVQSAVNLAAQKVYGPFQLYGPPNPAVINAIAFAKAKDLIVLVEGRKAKAYYDTQGILTVGIGHKVIPADNIAYGQIISEERIDALFNHDISVAFEAAKQQAIELEKYNADLIAVLTSVNFQLGTGWRSKFANTWSDLKQGNVESAISRLKQSKWYSQTPVRVSQFIQTLESVFT